MAGKRTMSSGCWIWPRLRWSAAGSARTRALSAAQWLWEFAPASTSSLSSAKSHQFLYFSHQMVQALGTYLVTATFLLAAIRVPQEEEWKCLMSFFFFLQKLLQKSSSWRHPPRVRAAGVWSRAGLQRSCHTSPGAASAGEPAGSASPLQTELMLS